MKVTPVSKTLADVLRGNFLRIPRFQRPYDWDRDNLVEFWNDLKDRSDPDYFMGSLVVFTDHKEKNLLSIVDGQQRITTITIMLSIIRDELFRIDDNGPAEAIHDLIETRDLDNKSRFVLEHDPKDRFMQYAIQSKNPDRKLATEGTQQQNLQVAQKFLSQALSSYLKNNIDQNHKDIANYLKRLRDCLLQMHFISIELDNEDDAYLIFETLNTRGKDLRVSDLLKNHFMRLLPAKTKGADRAKETWNDVIEVLSSATVSIDPDSFLLHYWLARYSYVSKANLFLHYKEIIKKPNAKASLDEIRYSANIYMKCMAPTEARFAKEERALQDSLNAIKIFGVAQAAPLVLSIMTAYDKKIISLKTTRTAIEYIEKFTFQFNALTQSRGGGGVSNMYAKLAQNVSGCDSSQKFTSVVKEMKEKILERLPDQSEFTLPFARLIYRNTYTRERALVRYVLAKLASHFGMPAEIDPSQLTIEHIQPQSNGEETGDAFDVGAIGNLIFMNESLNGKLDNKDFSYKKKFYTKEHNVYVDELLANSEKWTEDEIADRGVFLAAIGHSKIWNI